MVSLEFLSLSHSVWAGTSFPPSLQHLHQLEVPAGSRSGRIGGAFGVRALSVSVERGKVGPEALRETCMNVVGMGQLWGPAVPPAFSRPPVFSAGVHHGLLASVLTCSHP